VTLADAVGSVEIERLEVSAYRISTDRPESDGTFEWDSTTMVVVHCHAGGEIGLGYTYGSRVVGELIRDELLPVLEGRDAMGIRARWVEMRQRLRNIGRRDIGSMAVAAVDVALWDLKARLLGLPLVTLLGQVQEDVAVYGSGGFTSYSAKELARQFEGWAALGIRRFKMKVGRAPDDDPERVRHAREVVGPEAELFVDANGAYDVKQAIGLAQLFAREGVSWFEEPVTGEDIRGLRAVRRAAPPPMEIAAGEYGSGVSDFRPLLQWGAVDVLMPDATRCGGITGLLDAAALARAFRIPLSAHTAPALHLHPCCAIPEIRHIEYFHDHARIESMLLDGIAEVREGRLRPDLTRVGHGLRLREDAGNFEF
jgi:L-alanine-DL-glutamate epimerase-like enolase superfamily enzyme